MVAILEAARVVGLPEDSVVYTIGASKPDLGVLLS